MFKDFEDFWNNSGILESDSYKCIADTYQFTKENIPRAFESFGRNCYLWGRLSSLEEGRLNGIRDSLAYLNALNDMTDTSILAEMVKDLLEIYGKYEK